MSATFLIRPIKMLVVVFLFLSCAEEKEEIVVVTKHLKKQRETSTAVPDEFSSFAPAASGTSYWVEGMVRNDGVSDAVNVELVFKCTEGIDSRVLVANVRLIPAGKSVAYKTKGFLSKYDLKLTDEDPGIVVDR